MADNATVASDSPRSLTREPNPLGPPVDFDLRGVGRQLPPTVAPEGWIRKIERRREGKVWVGFFHLWTTNADGRRTRTKKEKTLGPASMAKHEAQQKLAEYIEEYTGRLSKQGNSITTFVDLWKAFSAVKAGQWSKKMREDLPYMFGKHVLPVDGEFVLMQQLVFGISRGNVSANDNVSARRLSIPESRSAFLPSAPHDSGTRCNSL